MSPRASIPRLPTAAADGRRLRLAVSRPSTVATRRSRSMARASARAHGRGQPSWETAGAGGRSRETSQGRSRERRKHECRRRGCRCACDRVTALVIPTRVPQSRPPRSVLGPHRLRLARWRSARLGRDPEPQRRPVRQAASWDQAAAPSAVRSIAGLANRGQHAARRRFATRRLDAKHGVNARITDSCDQST